MARELHEHTIEGRVDECARIEALLEALGTGTGGGLQLVGEPGTGKTTLLAWARMRAGAATVLETVGAEGEARLSYGALADLVRRLPDQPAARVDGRRGHRAPPRRARARAVARRRLAVARLRGAGGHRARERPAGRGARRRDARGAAHRGARRPGRARPRARPRRDGGGRARPRRGLPRGRRHGPRARAGVRVAPLRRRGGRCRGRARACGGRRRAGDRAARAGGRRARRGRRGAPRRGARAR